MSLPTSIYAGDQTTKTVLLENVGETVLFYTWERRPMQAIITTPKTIQGVISSPSCKACHGSHELVEVKAFKYVLNLRRYLLLVEKLF